MVAQIWSKVKQLIDKERNQAADKDNLKDNCDELRDESRKLIDMNRSLCDTLRVILEDLRSRRDIKLSQQSISRLSLKRMLYCSHGMLDDHVPGRKESADIYVLMSQMAADFHLSLGEGFINTAFWAALGLLETSLLLDLCDDPDTKMEMSNSCDMNIVSYAQDFLGVIRQAKELDELLSACRAMEREFMNNADELLQRFRARRHLLTTEIGRKLRASVDAKRILSVSLNEQEKAVFANDCRINHLFHSLEPLYDAWQENDNKADQIRTVIESAYKTLYSFTVRCEISSDKWVKSIREMMHLEFDSFLRRGVCINVVNPFDVGKVLDEYVNSTRKQMVSDLQNEIADEDAARREFMEYAKRVFREIPELPDEPIDIEVILNGYEPSATDSEEYPEEDDCDYLVDVDI